MNNNIVPLFLVAALFCCAWHFHGANCTLGGDKPPAVNINIPSGSKKDGDTSNAASLQDTSSASWPPSTGTIKRWQPRHRQQGGGSRSAASNTLSSSASLPSNVGIHLHTQHSGASNSASDIPSPSASLPSSPATDAWRIWKFDCEDLPRIKTCPACKTKIGTILESNDEHELGCKVCGELRKIWKKEPKQKMFTISGKRWPTYIKQTDSILRNVPSQLPLPDAILSSKDFLYPNQMGTTIGFNKQVGIGIFREGIIPDFDQQSLRNGGYFSLEFFANLGNKTKMYELNQMFNSFLIFMFGDVMHQFGLATELRPAVCGLFVRAEIDLANELPHNYDDLNNLPAKFRFELWILDQHMQNAMKKDLAEWIKHVPEELGFKCHNFAFKTGRK